MSMTLIVILALLVSLFLIAYLTKRRFGVLGLGLAAGLVLSQELTVYMERFLRYSDIPVEPLAYKTAAQIFLILIPALVMLFAGPRYYSKKSVVIGSLLFALLATVMLLGPLVRDLPKMDDNTMEVMSLIASNSSWIVTIGIVSAVMDTLHMHTKKGYSKGSKH